MDDGSNDTAPELRAPSGAPVEVYDPDSLNDIVSIELLVCFALTSEIERAAGRPVYKGVLELVGGEPVVAVNAFGHDCLERPRNDFGALGDPFMLSKWVGPGNRDWSRAPGEMALWANHIYKRWEKDPEPRRAGLVGSAVHQLLDSLSKRNLLLPSVRYGGALLSYERIKTFFSLAERLCEGMRIGICNRESAGYFQLNYEPHVVLSLESGEGVEAELLWTLLLGARACLCQDAVGFRFQRRGDPTWFNAVMDAADAGWIADLDKLSQEHHKGEACFEDELSSLVARRAPAGIQPSLEHQLLLASPVMEGPLAAGWLPAVLNNLLVKNREPTKWAERLTLETRLETGGSSRRLWLILRDYMTGDAETLYPHVLTSVLATFSNPVGWAQDRGFSVSPSAHNLTREFPSDLPDTQGADRWSTRLAVIPGHLVGMLEDGLGEETPVSCSCGVCFVFPDKDAFGCWEGEPDGALKWRNARGEPRTPPPEEETYWLRLRHDTAGVSADACLPNPYFFALGRRDSSRSLEWVQEAWMPPARLQPGERPAES